jgi:hypothetical protein
MALSSVSLPYSFVCGALLLLFDFRLEGPLQGVSITMGRAVRLLPRRRHTCTDAMRRLPIGELYQMDFATQGGVSAGSYSDGNGSLRRRPSEPCRA